MSGRAATLTLPPAAPTRRVKTGGPDLTGRLLYLPRLDAVLRIDSRHNDDWLCEIMAGRDDPLLHRRHIMLATGTLADAVTSLTIDPVTDPDGFATLIWHTTLLQQFLGPPVRALGRALAHQVRSPGEVAINLDPDTLVRIAHLVHVRPSALANILARLVDAQLLQPTEPPADRGLGLYTLTVPAVGGTS